MTTPKTPQQCAREVREALAWFTEGHACEDADDRNGRILAAEVYRLQALLDSQCADQPQGGEPVALTLFPKPWKVADTAHDGYCVMDANGAVIAKLFWPSHPPEQTEQCERETWALAEAIARIGQ